MATMALERETGARVEWVFSNRGGKPIRDYYAARRTRTTKNDEARVTSRHRRPSTSDLRQLVR